MAERTSPPSAKRPELLDRIQETSARVAELEARFKGLDAEVKVARGRLANTNPTLISDLDGKNLKLKKRLERLEAALFVLLTEAARPRQESLAKQQLDVLKQAAVEYCQKAKIDPDLWKNIAS